MKAHFFSLIFLVVMLSINCSAQITIDCANERIGIGYDLTSPSLDVHLKGTMRFEVPGGNYFDVSTVTGSGWGLRPNVNNTGILGYGYQLLRVDAKYIYGDYVIPSDKNLKNNIKPLYNALPIIQKLRPVSFDYNFDYSETEDINLKNKLEADSKNRLGFIAQEVKELLPQSVLEKDSSATLGIRMIDFIPLLVKGMQEQTVRIDSLSAVIADLKSAQNMLKGASINSTSDYTANNLATLNQNTPNPFSENTTINCFIPANSLNVELLVFDMQGTLVKTYNIPSRLQTSLTIKGAELRPGMYIYSLLIDGREIDSKRMILTK